MENIIDKLQEKISKKRYTEKDMIDFANYYHYEYALGEVYPKECFSELIKQWDKFKKQIKL